MGRKSNNEPDEEKPKKPKKIFIATFEMWDDGEISHDLVEKVQGERGAPRAWRLDPPEFMASVKARLADNKMKLLIEFCKGLNITEEELIAYYGGSKKSTPAPATPVVSEEKKESKKSEGNDEFDFESSK
jgi:hypothetical protein